MSSTDKEAFLAVYKEIEAEIIVDIQKLPALSDNVKNEEGSPPELVRSNGPFSQLEMCNIILTALPFNFAS